MPDVHSHTHRAEHGARERGRAHGIEVLAAPLAREPQPHVVLGGDPRREPSRETKPQGARSEEHTSELQSQSNLVCRLLLEKKKTNHIQPAYARVEPTH